MHTQSTETTTIPDTNPSTAQDITDDATLARALAKTATFTETERHTAIVNPKAIAYRVTHSQYNEGADKIIGTVRRTYPYTKHSRWVYVFKHKASSKTFKTRQEATTALFLALASGHA